MAGVPGGVGEAMTTASGDRTARMKRRTIHYPGLLAGKAAHQTACGINHWRFNVTRNGDRSRVTCKKCLGVFGRQTDRAEEVGG
jgi:hypothetical protein